LLLLGLRARAERGDCGGAADVDQVGPEITRPQISLAQRAPSSFGRAAPP
jgi:hypothetical protein